MQKSPHAAQTLMGAMRELVTQSERVARAEARVVASRLGDVARVGSRRLMLVAATAILAIAAVSFLLVAAYVALASVVAEWIAALIVAGGSLCLAGLCGLVAKSAPSGTDMLLPERSPSPSES